MSQLKVNSISDSAGANGNAITLASDGSCIVKATNNLSNRNKVINGNMQIAQRSGSTVNHSQGSAQYQTLDRWSLWMAATGGTITMSQSTESPNGFSNSLKLQCQTVDTSIAAGDLIRLQQGIEAQDLQDLGVGTSDAKQITISWYMKAVNPKTLTLNCYLPDATNDKWFSKNFTPTTSWARYSVTLPASTGGVINNDTGNGFSLGFVPFCGTTYSQASDSTAWSATEKYAVSGLGNFMDSTSNILYITGVQLEVGDVATDFEHRSYGDELRKCQRYFWQQNYTGTHQLVQYGTLNGGENIVINFDYPTEMRTTPTVTVSSAGHFRINDWSHDEDADGYSTKKAWTTHANLHFQKPTNNMTLGGNGYLNVSSSGSPSYIRYSSEL